jgi:hypothetical protein
VLWEWYFGRREQTSSYAQCCWRWGSWCRSTPGWKTRRSRRGRKECRWRKSDWCRNSSSSAAESRHYGFGSAAESQTKGARLTLQRQRPTLAWARNRQIRAPCFPRLLVALEACQNRLRRWGFPHGLLGVNRTCEGKEQHRSRSFLKPTHRRVDSPTRIIYPRCSSGFR